MNILNVLCITIDLIIKYAIHVCCKNYFTEEFTLFFTDKILFQIFS